MHGIDLTVIKIFEKTQKYILVLKIQYFVKKVEIIKILKLKIFVCKASFLYEDLLERI